MSSSAVPHELRRLPCPGPSPTPNGLVQREVDALGGDWVEHRQWVQMRQPPTQEQESELSGATEAWTERAEFIKEDLDFLLALPYHKFWSQMVYDESVQAHLGSLLQGLPRDYDIKLGSTARTEEVHATLQQLSRKLFLVFLRMATYKESKANFMTPEAFADLIYKHFLFDVPRLIDLCALFRPCNASLVDRMMDNVFRTQPAYNTDLQHSVVTVVNALITVMERTEVLTALPACDTPQQLEALVDLVSFATDVCFSVSAFMDSYPAGARAFHEQAFESKLAAVYQTVLVALSKYVVKQNEMKLLTEELYRGLVCRLQLSRKACVDMLRQIVSVCCLTPALEGSEDQALVAEDFLQIMSGCLSEGPILVDYNRLHSIQDDFDLFAQSGIELDTMRVQYVLDGVHSQAEEIGARVQKQAKKKIETAKSTGAVPKTKKASSPSQAGAGAATSDPTGDPQGVELESLISQVKDLLPDLGAGFVESCLQYFDFNPEKVINALFEENLPPHLGELDRTMARVLKAAPQAVVEKEEEKTSMQAKRRYNVYDGDEFDITERDEIDKTKIWRGKHSLVSKGSKNANALLNDKEEIRQMKDKFQGLDIVEDEVYVAPAPSGESGNILTAGVYDPEYDDEYDDTYDENAVGQAEPDAKDELTERRPFVLPRALGGGHVNYVKERNDDDDEEIDPREVERKKKEFVRNPAEMREERERKWQEKQNKGRGGRIPNRDVVGKAKGQGQEKQVLINRARKNANKGKQHRAGADRKAAKNMA